MTGLIAKAFQIFDSVIDGLSVSSYALLKRRSGKPFQPCNISYGSLLAFPEVADSAPVLGLRFCRGPSAVFGSISKFRIDAIQRHLWRSISHISPKCLEVAPPLADTNSASAVVGKLLVAWVKATPLHGSPALMRRAAGRRVSSPASANHLFLQTTAASRIPSAEGVASDRGYRPAITNTFPDDSLSVAGRPVLHSADCDQPPVSGSRSIHKLPHGGHRYA